MFSTNDMNILNSMLREYHRLEKRRNQHDEWAQTHHRKASKLVNKMDALYREYGDYLRKCFKGDK